MIPRSSAFILLSYLALILIVLSGCAKRELVDCPKEDFSSFIVSYGSQNTIDSLKGNGTFEAIRENGQFNELSGNFSLYYSNEPRTWGITLYGFFGMILSQITIKGDSFVIYSPMLEKPFKGLVKNFNIEEYTGIPIDAISVQLLSIGRIPFDETHLPSYCVQNNKNSIEFSYEIDSNIRRVGWSLKDERIEYYTIEKKGKKDIILVKFKNYKKSSESHLPYSIHFVYQGSEEASLKLDYKYMEVQ